MLIFAFQCGPEIHLSYTPQTAFGSTYLGCGETKDQVWELVNGKISYDDFLTKYQDLIKRRLDDWETNPFERMKRQEFLKRYEKGEEL